MVLFMVTVDGSGGDGGGGSWWLTSIFPVLRSPSFRCSSKYLPQTHFRTD